MSLTVKVYSTGTTEINSGELTRIQGERHGTQYPAGLYTDASFFVPRNIVRSWQLAGAQRVAIYNGLNMVWEGRITNLGYQLEETSQGNLVTARGYWAEVLMRRGKGWGKPWADTAIGQDVWSPDAADAGAAIRSRTNVDRTERIRITPRGDWLNTEVYSLLYAMPAGVTIKRVTCMLNFVRSAPAQVWTARLWNITGAAAEWTYSTDQTALALDTTFATPATAMYLQLLCGANQTAPNTGANYMEVKDLVVYSETGAINATEIIKDVAAKDARLSTDLSLIASNTLTLVPFVATEEQSLADILDTVARFGDASYNPWACGLRASDQASDGKPILFYEQYPDLTDYDYAVRIDDTNLVTPFNLSLDYDEIYNWITVAFRNAQGQAIKVTPDDDANLKDTASITAYGQSDYLLNVDTTEATVATNLGRHILATHKDPIWRVDGGIGIVGSIRGKGQQVIPACEIQAGKRIKIENWLDDLSGTGLTFLISTTNYDAEADTCSIGVGNVDRLEIILAQLEHSRELGAV